MFIALLIALLLHITGMFLVKKKQTPVLWIENLIYSLMGTMGILVFLSAVLRLFHIPLVPLSMTIMLLLSAAGLGIYIRKKGKQEVEFRLWDILFLVIMLGSVFLYAKGYFTIYLRPHFVSSDAGRHFSFAYKIFSTGKTDLNMYYAAMNESVLMMVLKPFLSGVLGNIKVFVLALIMDLILSGLLMYGLVAPYLKTPLAYILAYVLCGLYVLGYPLYAVQFGLVYFEASILIIQFLLLIIRDYLDEASPLLLILLNVELFALMVCYTYFVPVVFLSLFFAIFAKRFAQKEKIFAMAFEELRVFLIPSVFGLYFSFGNLGELSSKSDGGIATDGGCYADLFSNFLWLVPIALLGLFICFKKKKPILISMTFFNLLFTGILFYFAMQKKVSPYYYFKEYSLLWLLAFLLFFVGTLSLTKESVVVAVALLLLPIGCFGINKMEGRISGVNERFVNVPAGAFCNIYLFNYDFYRLTIPMLDTTQECFGVVNSQYSDGECFAIGDEASAAWFEAVTGEKDSIVYGDAEDVKKKVESGNYDYVCVFSSELANESEEYLKGVGNVVFLNDTAYIVEIAK